MHQLRDTTHSQPHPRASGFTLIELIVVLAIVALLLTLALPRYFHSLEASKEAVLKENLHTTRQVIDKFYADTGHYPDSLDELVQRKYLRQLPVDPVLDTNSSWILIAPDGDAEGRIYDLKSAAPGSTRDGVPFNEL